MTVQSKLVALGLVGALSFVGGCSRHKIEAVKLANKGDQIVELDPNGAIESYEQAKTLDPTNHRILYKLAKAYKKKEQWDKVASTLAQATQLAPSFANYWFERGWALEKQAQKGTISYDECKKPYKKLSLELRHKKSSAESSTFTARAVLNRELDFRG